MLATALAPPTGEALLEAGFTQLEKDVALLLIEGDTRRDIARRLHLTTEEMNKQVVSIRGKVSGEGELDPAIAAVVKKHKLTRRERDMLRCLRQNKTNVEIAAELFLSEETVRIHIRNLMTKLPIDTRQEISPWLETLTQKEKNIVLAIFRLYSHGLRAPEGGAPVSLASEGGTPMLATALAPPTGEALLEAGFTQLEKDVALLLIEGDTRRDIARRLHLTTEEMNKQVVSIRGKVSGEGELDPAIAAVVKKHKLTRRERDMLRCLRQNKTNTEIASELFLSEETVRIHVRNLMNKLPVDSRQEVSPWLETLAHD
jgi:DNA-binding CsgD family transcriptional regulator